MTFIPLTPSETGFKDPIDETLWGKVRENFDDHESRLGASSGGGSIAFKVNGDLELARSAIENDPALGRMLDGALVTAGQTFTRVRLFLKKNGISGQTRIDIKRHRRVNHAIEFVNAQLDRTIQAVGRVGGPLATQAVTKRTPQIATQSITRAKSTLSAASVVVIEAGVSARYNIAGGVLLDADYKIGKKIKISSMINGANDGEFTILDVNPDGWPGLILDNTAAVNETGSSGSADLQFFSYNFINPADVVGFKVGENAILATHTLAVNDGTFEIVRINDAGNNILFYNDNAGADVQPGIAGTADCTRFVYTFAAAVIATDYFQDETGFFSGHTSGANDGNLLIKEINESGNNIVVINESGVVQAGTAGTAETNRWTYSTNTDPSPDIAVGDLIRFENMTSAANDGDFILKEINRFALNNLTIFNESGVAQGGVGGTVRSELVVIGFDADFSSFYEAGRSIGTIKGFVNLVNNGFFDIIEINRGGGAAYNIVIKNIESIDEADPIGQVDLESRSIFDSDLPTIQTGEDVTFTGDSAVFNPASVEVDAMVSLDILELPEGSPEDLSVDLS